MVASTFTPNLHLEKLPANYRVWAQKMNDNLTLLDAAVSGFIVFNNLKGAWSNSTVYAVGDTVVDVTSAVVYQCQVAHTSALIPTTFLADRTAHTTYWTVYSSPARSRGVWTGPGTAYALNDFVVANGNQFAICIAANTSGVTFAADLALGRWSVLVDLSLAGSLVLPVLTGVADANKVVSTNPTGGAYVINTQAQTLALLGATSLGITLFQAASAAAARTALGLGTAALLDAGTAVSNLVQMIAGPKLPAVDGSLLTNLPGINSVTSFLAVDVAMPNPALHYDGPNTGSIGAAGQTWLLIALCTMTAAAATTGETSIFDGSAYIACNNNVGNAAGVEAGGVCAIVVTLAAATTFTARAQANAASAGLRASSVSNPATVAGKATYITAVRLA